MVNFSPQDLSLMLYWHQSWCDVMREKVQEENSISGCVSSQQIVKLPSKANRDLGMDIFSKACVLHEDVVKCHPAQLLPDISLKTHKGILPFKFLQSFLCSVTSLTSESVLYQAIGKLKRLLKREAQSLPLPSTSLQPSRYRDAGDAVRKELRLWEDDWKLLQLQAPLVRITIESSTKFLLQKQASKTRQTAE